MFVYEKKLQYPVNIKQTNAKLAKIIITQYGDTERNTLVAKLALCHPLHLLAVIKSRLGHSQAVDTIADCITKCKYYFQKR